MLNHPCTAEIVWWCVGGFFVDGKKMTDIEKFLWDKIRFEELSEAFCSAVSFYGDFMKDWLMENECNLLFNDKKHRTRLGDFSSDPLQIRVHSLKEQLDDKSLDCVYVHEMAHFLDSMRAPKYTRYRWASSSRNSKERAIITLFRSKMVPFPKKRTNYRGRTCELFARSIEEYYAIKTENAQWIKTRSGWDYYVNIEDFKNTIYPVVEDYLNFLRKEGN